MDDLIQLLIQQPELWYKLKQEPFSLQSFPPEYHPFIYSILEQPETRQLLDELLQLLNQPRPDDILPRPRSDEPVYIYEDGNPFKEIGLKTHFERLGRYHFITRLQSYRYLSRRKASNDRVQYLYPDRLGGIFSNKEKSIYYYIFLSESNEEKARNAANLLNLALYGKSGGA